MYWKQNINPFQPKRDGSQNVKGNFLSQNLDQKIVSTQNRGRLNIQC